MNQQTDHEQSAIPEKGRLRGIIPKKWRLGEDSRPDWLFLIGGAVFPFFVMILELVTRICAMDFIDPMPTFWHALLVGSVPLANLWTWLALRRHVAFRPRTIGIVNGYAMGVSFMYTLWFLPMLPLALIAMIVWGLGLLPMAPLFSFIAAVSGYIYLKRLVGETRFWKVPGTLWGIAVFLVATLAIEAPVTTTRIGMNLACSDKPEVRVHAIRALRMVGSEEMMLRSCYRRWGRAFDPLSFFTAAGSPVQPEKAREVYFRVTGTPFNAVPPPAAIRGWGRMGFFAEGNFDFALGDQVVGGRVRGLTLDASRIDGSVDADAALAYIEWTMEFKNHFEAPREARAQVALPAGGVVSRVTLWVDGQEREAAFAGRSKVREAYQKIVRQRRDPLLVTTSGPDRVMVQCFPVPARGGTMKIRIGMTAPITLQDTDRAYVRLPRFVERNFMIPRHKRHLVWIESKIPLTSDNEHMVTQQPSADVSTLRGELTESDLCSEKSAIRVKRSPQITIAWCEDELQGPGRVVIQTVEEKSTVAPEKIALVVDGSRGMDEFIPQIVEAISAIPAGKAFAGVVIADDGPIPYETPVSAMAADKRVAEELRVFQYRGGRDNVSALARAFDMVGDGSRGAIVWVHRPQPVLMETVEGLRQRWERRGNSVTLYSLEVASGPDRVMEKLDGIQSVKSVPRIGSLQHDMKTLFTSWKPDAKLPVFSRSAAEQEPQGLGQAAKKTSNHLARLWAYDEIMRLKSGRGKQEQEAALKLAAQYHLVTPMSGAVVLETAQQFQAEGLEPAAPAKVPTIPEPETWVLIVLAMLIVVWVVWRKKMLCKDC